MAGPLNDLGSLEPGVPQEGDAANLAGSEHHKRYLGLGCHRWRQSRHEYGNHGMMATRPAPTTDIIAQPNKFGSGMPTTKLTTT